MFGFCGCGGDVVAVADAGGACALINYMGGFFGSLLDYFMWCIGVWFGRWDGVHVCGDKDEGIIQTNIR